MLINKNTLVSLLAFYKQDPYARVAVEEDPYNVVIWELIFEWFYQKKPKDTKLLPAHFRAGQSDPLWDDLLHVRQALTCQNFLYKISMRKKKYQTRTQKAA